MCWDHCGYSLRFVETFSEIAGIVLKLTLIITTNSGKSYYGRQVWGEGNW